MNEWKNASPAGHHRRHPQGGGELRYGQDVSGQSERADVWPHYRVSVEGTFRDERLEFCRRKRNHDDDSRRNRRSASTSPAVVGTLR
jgi:hypothetical protein